MTDTPMTPPVTRMERVKAFIGDIARPFAIIWTSLCAGIATLVLASRISDPVQAGVFIGIVYTTGVAPLFIGKAVEVASGNKQTAKVEIARAQSPQPPTGDPA